MATKNTRALKANAAASKETPAMTTATVTVVESDEAMPMRSRKASETTTVAQQAFAVARGTITDGASRPYRAEGEKAAALIAQLRRVAADHNMQIRTADSATAGAILWQVIDKPPSKRPRTAKSAK